MTKATPFRVLAISGSLRNASSNGSIVSSAQSLAPAHVHITIYDGLGSLPLFNPDTDGDPAHPQVQCWRDALRTADAVLLSSPEYAHGVPGAVKNALDWVVGSGELMEKPMALVNASPYAEFITPQLTETLHVMMARVVYSAAITLTSRTGHVNDVLDNRAAADTVRAALSALTASPTTTPTMTATETSTPSRAL